MADLTHWRSENKDLNYLGAWDIPFDGEKSTDLELTIKSVGNETVVNPKDNSKKVKLVIHFEEPNYKPMIVNSTNCDNISQALGSPYIETWVGRKIAIYSQHGKWFGKEGDALRIRTKAPSSITYRCLSCQKIILKTSGKTPEELVEMSKANCEGQILCVPCMKKYKEEHLKGKDN